MEEEQTGSNGGKLAEFEAGTIDPAKFHHGEHLRIGFEMLHRYCFSEAAVRIAAGLRQLAANNARPEMYNETMTIAFLAVIAERVLRAPSLSWEEFMAANPELASKDYLERWYPRAVLYGNIARQTFVLPPVREQRT